MKVRFSFLSTALSGSLLLALLAACGDTADTPQATAPPDPTPGQAAEPLSAGDRMAVDEFAGQWEAIVLEWDQLHQDLDQWRAGLTSCHRSSVHEALQGFAADFAGVTLQAGNLPRTTITQELADILVAAAEEEEAAFRQLRDRWQPDDTALFEQVELRRSDAAQARRDVEDMSLELREQLETAADPRVRAELMEFSEAVDAVSDDWNGFHGDYAALQDVAVHLDPFTIIAELDQLIAQFDAIVDAVSELPSVDATESMAKTLLAEAEAEREALIAVHSKLQESLTAPFEAPPPHPLGGTGSPLDEMDAVFEESEALLERVSGTIELLLEDDLEDKLAEIENFDVHRGELLVAWDAFHQGYRDWRKTDGGCDRTEVLQALDGFNLRMSELGREVRRLPQSSYLLPMYTLLVEAAEREEGAVRALRNSWRPFTVDAFKVMDQERLNADRLRRQAGIGLQGLSDRS